MLSKKLYDQYLLKNEYDIEAELKAWNDLKEWLHDEAEHKSIATIIDTLTKSITKEKKVIEVTLKSMIEVANNTIKSHIDSLTESEKKQLNVILNTSDEKLNQKYGFLKEDVIEKLETLLFVYFYFLYFIKIL